jgi:hypothetical protein
MDLVFLIVMRLFELWPAFLIVGGVYWVHGQLQVGRDVAGTGA